MKTKKPYHPKLIKTHSISIKKRMLFRKIWYIFAPISLIIIMIITWTIIQADVYNDINRMKGQIEYQELPEIKENQETNNNVNNIKTEKTYAYDNPIMLLDGRIKQSGTGLSALTESEVRNTKKKITYADLNKYGRPGIVTAYITNENLTNAAIDNTITNGVVTINMIPKVFGGETKKENNVILLGNVYSNCYVPIMNSLLNYVSQTKNDIIIRITPTWSNIQFDMPDIIRIDAYSVKDLGASLNTNFVINNRYTDSTIVDYHNPENNQ